jgi:hypothetical protein
MSCKRVQAKKKDNLHYVVQKTAHQREISAGFTIRKWRYESYNKTSSCLTFHADLRAIKLSIRSDNAFNWRSDKVSCFAIPNAEFTTASRIRSQKSSAVLFGEVLVVAELAG